MSIDKEPVFLLVNEIISKYPTKQFPHPEIGTLTATGIKAAIGSAIIVRTIFDGTTKPSDLKIEWKEDATARTVADVEGDFKIVETIREERPQDDIFIEESGFHQGIGKLHGDKETAVIWDADSVDGTRPFTEGKPWSVCAVGARNDTDYLLGVIVHPFRQKLAFAMRGMGAWVVSLNADMEVKGRPERVQVGKKTSFAGATIAVDSYRSPANFERKTQLLKAIDTNAFSNKGLTSQDAVGSNIAYQLDVALGVTDFGITDFIPADKGSWDWRIGEALIVEAGGLMLDPITGKRPTSESQVVIYGNSDLVNLILPKANRAYRGYEKGFTAYDFNMWK